MTSHENESSSSTNSSRVIRVKLPKLEVSKFNGRPEKWQEFWDGFDYSIHSNPNLSTIDKFSYLRGLVEEPAKTAIARFVLTLANYEAAIDLLKLRFGRKENIHKAHINELMKVAPVTSARNPVRLRKLYDTVETHHRGLKALGDEPNIYSAIVVPSIIEKLPESVRLIITRGKTASEWNMDQLLYELLKEVELREEHASLPSKEKQDTGNESNKRTRPPNGPNTGSALLANATDNSCTYCKGNHKHNDYTKVSSIAERIGR